MKYSWHIITVILAAAFVVLAATSLTATSAQNSESINEEQIILNSIMTRTSVRKYSDETISESTMETILKAGMAAPTAGNRQPWEFYVVRDTDIIRQFTDVTKYTAPMASHAQVAIIACGVPSESFPHEPQYWVQDVSAATENILLAAHAMGLGAVWCGVYPGEDRVATLRQMLNIPEKLIPFNIIMFGYPDPASPTTPKNKWKPSKVHYIN